MRYTHAHSHVVVRCRSLKSSQKAKVEMSETRKRRSTGNVTLADVAKQAGVGTMTVSRALRTPDLVSENSEKKFSKSLMNWVISQTKLLVLWLPPKVTL